MKYFYHFTDTTCLLSFISNITIYPRNEFNIYLVKRVNRIHNHCSNQSQHPLKSHVSLMMYFFCWNIQKKLFMYTGWNFHQWSLNRLIPLGMMWTLRKPPLNPLILYTAVVYGDSGVSWRSFNWASVMLKGDIILGRCTLE